MKHLSGRGAAVVIASAAVGVAALAAALAPGSAASAGTAAKAAAAANVNQWRLANVWTHTQGQFYGVASSAPNEAWAVGFTGPQASPTGPMAAHWGGKAWQTVVVPGSKGYILDAVGESSPTNVWVDGYNSQTNTESAFVFDGVHWHMNQLPAGGAQLLLVFAPNDVWIANDNECSSHGCTENIYHWNGIYWQYRPLATFLYALTGPSGGNLWAVGRAGAETGYLTAYRWTGGQWVTRAIPHVQGAAYLGAAATSAETWISSLTTNYQHTYVLHGTAAGWKTITVPSGVDAFAAAPVPDGHGGAWLDAQAHYTGGRWLTEWLPGTFFEGWTGINAAFVKSPATTGSYWSAGYTQPAGNGPTHPAVSVFGPLP